MNPVWLRLRAGLAERARSWIALAVIIGVFGGIVIAAAAGARRTDNAYPRFLASQRAYQQFFFTDALYPGSATFQPDQVRALPEVQTVVEGEIYDALLPDGSPMVMRGSTDARLDRTLNAVNLLDGRLPEAADEILVTALFAEDRGTKVGDRLRMKLVVDQSGESEPVDFDARVSGIGIAPGEFPPENDIGVTHWAHVSPAFVGSHHGIGARFAYVFLHRADADLESFQKNLNKLAGDKPVIGYQQASLTKNVRRAFHLQAVSLWLLALLLGVTVTALIAQTISRVTWTEAADHPVLSAVGMTRTQLFAVAMLRVVLVSAVASVVAAALAYGLSPLSPSGRARDAVVDPGLSFDWAAIGLGAVAVIVVCALAAAIPGWRSAGIRSTAAQQQGAGRSLIAEAVLRGGAPPTTGIGLRFALERGRGRTAVPTRATMLGATLAVAAVAMTLSFGGSLAHLLHTPRLYGATYDVIGRSLSESVSRADAPRVMAQIRSVPGVAAAAEGAAGLPLRVDGELADAIALDPDAGPLLPPLLKGRYPREADEIMLAVNTLKKSGHAVGDIVNISALGTKSLPFRVVGVGVIPVVGHSGNLGEGSMISVKGARRIFEGVDTLGDIVIKLRPGVAVAAASAAITRATGGVIDELEQPVKPGDLVNFGGQRNLPFLLAAILGFMAAVTIGHALLSSINRRRRDIAILKTTGFTPRQARLTIGWQATMLMIVGLAFGLPAGIVAGRELWTTYAHTLGIIPEARPSLSLLLLIPPAALVAANLIALFPGVRAARIQPAVVLHTE